MDQPKPTPTVPLTFSIVGMPILSGEAPAGAVFDESFAGTFTVRAPSILDEPRIDARVTAFFETEGVQDPGAVPMRAYRVVRAIVLLETLAIEKPDWAAAAAPSRPLLQAALLTALRLAEEWIGGEKKSATADGEPKSTGA